MSEVEGPGFKHDIEFDDRIRCACCGGTSEDGYLCEDCEDPSHEGSAADHGDMTAANEKANERQMDAAGGATLNASEEKPTEEEKPEEEEKPKAKAKAKAKPKAKANSEEA